ncbi:glycogen debranching protein GlgX [Gulosibacter molinativorax]|uniref:Glycogen debranching enzyme GlgX n=1 Tax=Gulosibacter molinativorax TaxID=256821 RepID=A0ABT7CC28_9MICO|nr:glycogen debranching protein GlgX [Gulosibacter molinativorax]MDJ1372643.1 glycogen debranching enzyme GlgX [Gulosibacter molinativorax]QUY60769.1 Glycogen operon protein GlgX homolog [Gulosibacter molinativorax]
MDAPETGALGITLNSGKPRLRVFSENATAVTVVLLSEQRTVLHEIPLSRTGDVWEVESSVLVPGAYYALRIDGPHGPHHGFDPKRLSLDPYARHVVNLGDARSPFWVSRVVREEEFDWGVHKHPHTPMRDTVIYEAHLKGLTKLAHFVPEELRGTYAGLAHENVVAHLTNLGITAVELLPVQAFTSERHLRRDELTNYWGYNTLGFFAPHADYATKSAQSAGPEAIAREFKSMVRTLHAAGIEVLLDVVYNHTADEGAEGDSVLFRGIDRASYYRQDPAGNLVDVTGCGNSLNTAHPVAQRFVLDSLRYWTEEFGIDGFRFDLAVTLGRDGGHGYTPDHPLLHAIVNDPILEKSKIIAEPWDVGIGGWQTGHFPAGWSEWNDEYRDRLRRFWVESFSHARVTGQHREAIGKLATAIAGSSNRFTDDRGPLASVNFVTAHDGFTLRDLVSYNVKHNLMNHELGRDGTDNNHSYNFGLEGETEHAGIQEARRLTVRNLIGTLLISAGVPMLTAGDELSRTQHGNNNPYNQDNGEFSWIDWELSEAQEQTILHTRRLIEIRRNHPVLRPGHYNHTTETIPDATRFSWFDAFGQHMADWQWTTPASRSVQFIASSLLSDGTADQLLVIIHGVTDPAPFRLPQVDGVGGYRLLWDSAAYRVSEIDTDAMSIAAPRQRMRLVGPSMRIYEVIDSE